jgi:uncharacterized protein
LEPNHPISQSPLFLLMATPPLTTDPLDQLSAKRDQLLSLLQSFGSAAVAFSGGVDSAVLAKAAVLALGDRAVAVTGTSASLASGELEQAQSVAGQMGIRHEVIATDEFNQPAYLQNAPDRCYHCKSELYLQMDQVINALGVAVVCNGANVDDLRDYRPGMQAAAEHQVRSPLAECGFTKDDVRALARHWNLPVWDKPASPCLSSRVAYGEEVTPQRLTMIDRGEQWLRAEGILPCRVRYHRGDLARIEVPSESLMRLVTEPLRSQLISQFRALGWKYVSIDVEGFRSGSLNQVLPIESLLKP